jgi:ATP-dependent Clp protease adapter protein ClpS
MSDTMTDERHETTVTIAPRLDLPEPPHYRVIYINDETTTQEFVVETLKVMFGYTTDAAINLTLQVHEHGSTIVAVLPYEIAEQKGVEVTMLARNNGFPLQVKIEPDV